MDVDWTFHVAQSNAMVSSIALIVTIVASYLDVLARMSDRLLLGSLATGVVFHVVYAAGSAVASRQVALATIMTRSTRARRFLQRSIRGRIG
ncbi:hypothetical protein DFJ73DRAFT_812730, partial [Zopfochytrium polystomum]